MEDGSNTASQHDLKRMAKWFKILRWYMPITFLIIGFLVLPYFLKDLPIFFQIAIIGLAVWDYFLFDRMYKNYRDKLKERFGERV